MVELTGQGKVLSNFVCFWSRPLWCSLMLSQKESLLMCCNLIMRRVWRLHQMERNHENFVMSIQDELIWVCLQLFWSEIVSYGFSESKVACINLSSSVLFIHNKLLDGRAHKSLLAWWFKELKKYTEDASYHFQSTSDGMKFLWKDSWMCGRDLANRQQGSFRSALDRRLSFFSSVSKELYTKWYYWESLLFLIAVPRDQSSQEAPEFCSHISFSFEKESESLHKL